MVLQNRRLPSPHCYPAAYQVTRIRGLSASRVVKKYKSLETPVLCWQKAVAYITGTVDEELLLRREYLSAENRILIQQLQGSLRLTDPQRQTLAEIGHRLGRKALGDVANIVRPETILSWHRQLVAKKFDGSKARATVGRPQISQELQALILRMARENAGWGYYRIAGALKNLGHTVSDQSIGNILKRHDIPKVPQCKMQRFQPFD